MNNNMEIQREAIIEIVGTQYEGRAINHQPMFLQQELILKHQSDNFHDHNAVLLLTDDGKELGFLPKGYASLYAPAIDSGRYSFTVEVVKSESDPERPILIVKITSELKNHSEEEIENDILGFVQNIVNGCVQITAEYFTFINSETVNVDDLLSTLNKARLIQKLHSCSSAIIESRAIKQNSDKYTPISRASLTKYLSDLKADVSDILKKIQKLYNESLDIDDEEEYHRVQSEIRERRKKFRSYDDLLNSLLDAVTSYVNVSLKTAAIPEANEPEPTKPDEKDTDTMVEAATFVSESVQTVTTQLEPETKTPSPQESTQLEQLSGSEDTTSAPVTFNPEITKPFVLKEALTEILLTDAPEITKYHEHRGGISSKNLRELIKEYYGKSIGLFEISKLLMFDKTFRSVGKGCYILNEAMIPHEEAESEHVEHCIPERAEPAEDEIETVQINHTPVTQEMQLNDASVEQIVVTEDKLKVVEQKVSDTISTETQEITVDARHIVLKLNGKVIRAYDYSDALNKVCEFAINCKPFEMARIAGQAIQIHGKSVFYRKAVPVDGYNKLSNGLQIITITALSDLQMITAAVQKYCQIDDDMIAIISKEIHDG